MERLGLLDAEFWDLEDEHVALHIGAIAVFDGPVPSARDLTDRYLARLDRMPRLRQKMRGVRFNLARPRWFDDPAFDLSYHLRRTAVPHPGTPEQLNTAIGRIMSFHLDQSRPLWEAWIVEGLADDQWALVFKVHHSIVDGVSGMKMFSAFLDDDEWRPVGRSGSAPAALVDAARDVLRTARSIALRPDRTVRTLGHAARGVVRFAGALRPVTKTSLTGALGTPRRYRPASVELADVDTVRRTLGGTRNDVVLAMVTRAFRELLISRGEQPGPHAVRCLVPVAVGRGHRDGINVGNSAGNSVGNKVSAMLVDLPVEFADIETAYAAIGERMHELKSSAETEAGATAASVAEHLPTFLVSAIVRGALRVPHRVLTTVTTNVPGPRTTRTLLGHRMVAVYPYVPIADGIRIGVAVVSYADQLQFGITCDRASVDDIEVFVNALEDGLRELLKIASGTHA